MRFLFVVTNLRGGGAERATLNLAKGLAGRGHEPHIVLLEHFVEYPVPPTLPVHALTEPGVARSGSWLAKLYSAWKLSRLHRRLTRNGDFDLIVSTLPLADEVVGYARLPRVWHRIANTLSLEIAALENPLRAARRRARYRRLYEGRRLIAVSNGVAEDLRGAMRLSRAEIATIYNPFDFEEVQKHAAADEPDLPNAPYLVYAGRFQPQKRFDLLLDAFNAASLPHQLVLLTAPSPALSALIASRNLEQRVVVAGFRTNPFPWFANASALVLSSDREGMPSVLVEALICGTPVVSTNCPCGPNEVLTGPMKHWLVPCGDIGALAARLREVVEVKPKIDGSILQRFSKEACFEAIEALARRKTSASNRPERRHAVVRT